MEDSLSNRYQWSQAVGENTAKALSYLTGVETDAMRLTILNVDGALARLVKSVSWHRSSPLGISAAEALRNLTATELDSIKWAIVSEDGVLACLVNCVLSDREGCVLRVRELVAETVRNLAAAKGYHVKKKIVNERGALAALVWSLNDRHEPHNLQIQAAWAIESLAEGSLHGQIFREPGLLSGLVTALFEDTSPVLQSHAARALTNLAGSRYGSLRLRSAEEYATISKRIAKENGAIEGLVKALLKYDKPDLQTSAALALLKYDKPTKASCTLRYFEILIL